MSATAKFSITDADGNPVGEFTVNQAGDTPITLPAIPVVEDQIHIGDTYPRSPNSAISGSTPPSAHLSSKSGTTATAPQNGNPSAALNPPHPLSSIPQR